MVLGATPVVGGLPPTRPLITLISQTANGSPKMGTGSVPSRSCGSFNSADGSSPFFRTVNAARRGLRYHSPVTGLCFAPFLRFTQDQLCHCHPGAV